MTNNNYKNKLLLLHFVVFIWGFAGVFGRAITLSATQLIWFRMLIAPLGILAYLLYKKTKLRISKKELIHFSLVGLLIAAHWICFYGAIKVSNISITLACFSTTAFFTALAEPFFFKRKMDWIEVILGFIAFIAIAVIFSFEQKYKLGILLSILSAIGAMLFTIFNAKLVQKSNPSVMSFYELSTGWIGLSIFILFTGGFSMEFFHVSTTNLLLLLVFSLISTAFTFIVSTELLKHISPFTVNLTVNLEVVYGIILAFLFFGEDERMTPAFYISTSFILLVLFANAWIKKRRVK